ncbi:MAG: type I-U CRISPR-associated protein Cas5/Cas6, partial [Desulfobacteraceae bacterium 4572_87]
MLDQKTCYLELSVLYLTDRYHGKGDWPPSPARLFQALTAAGRKGSSSSEWHHSVALSLKWLEEISAPLIFAPETTGSGAFVITGPRNQGDKAVKSMGIDEKRMRKQRDLKPLSPVFLPEALENRFLRYLWSVSKAEAEKHRSEIESICRMAKKMTHLGYGIDQIAVHGRIVQGDQVQSENVKLYEPCERPTLLRYKVPAKGYLENLIDLYEAKRNRLSSGVVFPYSHPEKYRLVYYRKEGEVSMDRSVSIFALKSIDGSGRTVSVRWRDAAMTVAPWARHGAGVIAKKEGYAKEWIDRFVLGHTSEGARDQRLSYLPLPSIGHKHADGGIRRFAIAEPVGSKGKATEILEWGLPYFDL